MGDSNQFKRVDHGPLPAAIRHDAVPGVNIPTLRIPDENLARIMGVVREIAEAGDLHLALEIAEAAIQLGAGTFHYPSAAGSGGMGLDMDWSDGGGIAAPSRWDLVADIVDPWTGETVLNDAPRNEGTHSGGGQASPGERTGDSRIPSERQMDESTEGEIRTRGNADRVAAAHADAVASGEEDMIAWDERSDGQRPAGRGLQYGGDWIHHMSSNGFAFWSRSWGATIEHHFPIDIVTPRRIGGDDAAPSGAGRLAAVLIARSVLRYRSPSRVRVTPGAYRGPGANYGPDALVTRRRGGPIRGDLPLADEPHAHASADPRWIHAAFVHVPGDAGDPWKP